jgi:hypothetical protein
MAEPFIGNEEASRHACVKTLARPCDDHAQRFCVSRQTHGKIPEHFNTWLEMSPAAVKPTRSVVDERPFTANASAAATRLQAVPVILVGRSFRDYADLRQCLRGAAWSVFWAHDAQSAMMPVRRFAQPIIICSDELQGDTWQGLLDAANSLPTSPVFVLARAKIDSQSWAEALHWVLTM